MRMRLRPNVLAHPSPTTGRFVLLMTTILGAGLVAGQMLYLGVRARDFAAQVRECMAAGGNELVGVTTGCMRPEYAIEAGFQLGGVLTIVLVALLLLAVTPAVIRRRHRLRPATVADAQARVAELAAEAGLRRAPRIFVGPAGQRDAFVFGLPRRYRLVLPTALLVRWRNQDLFDPVVRHELAHLRRQDVTLAWLAATVWVAAIPVLLVPVASSLLRADLGLVGGFVLRSALLLGLTWLVRRQVLRSREYDADLLAAQHKGWRPLWTILQTSTGRPRTGLRQVTSNHPTTADRMAVLADPARLTSVSFVDGLVAAFLAWTLLPIVQELIGRFNDTPTSILWAGLLVGPILGVAVGVGLWRQALVDHVNGEAKWPGGVVAGVVCGLILATLMDFSNYGFGDVLGTGATILEVVFAIFIGASATILSASTGRIWADAAGRLPAGRWGWMISLVINSVLFGLAVWALKYFPVVLQATGLAGLGWGDVVIGVGATIQPLTYVALVPALVTMLALVLRRRVTPVPAWLLDGGPQTYAEVTRRPGLPMVLLGGVVCGGVIALATLMHRLFAGVPGDVNDRTGRYLVWLLTATLAAMAVSCTAVILIPRSGAAIGLVSGGVTAITGAIGILAFQTFVVGNSFALRFWWEYAFTIAGQWLVGYLFVAPLALASWPGRWRDVPGWLLGLLSLVAAGLVSLIVVGLALL